MARGKGHRLPYLALVASGVLALFIAPLLAQVTGPETPTQPETKKSSGIKMDVEMALVNVTVTDPYSRLVTGLDKENFKVYEDGVEQEISTFSSEDVPISIGLIFDMSGSMADKVDKARQAAVQFLRTANPQDEFFLVSFNDRAEVSSRFTSSIEELAKPHDVYRGQGPHRPARWHLSRPQPDEGCTQRQARLAHHLRWGR